MNSQNAYRSFAANAPDLPLFLEPWYLDAVCQNGVWDAVMVKKGDRTVAAWPFFLKKKWGSQYIAMPQLCKFLGPYLLPECRNLNDEMRLYEALLSQFPQNLAAFQQDFNYSVTNWLPLFWQGFRQTTRYSYVLDLDPTEATLLGQIAKNYRQKLRSAAEKLTVVRDLPLSELHRLINLSFARQGLEAPLSAAFLEGLHHALEANNRCQLFFAVDTATKAVHSAAMLVWDKRSAYFLLSGDDPALRASGSAILLKWEAILHAKNVLNLPIFDFEGSMIKSIEAGRRDFGARQQPYFRIQKEWSRLWKWAKRVKKLF